MTGTGRDVRFNFFNTLSKKMRIIHLLSDDLSLLAVCELSCDSVEEG